MLRSLTLALVAAGSLANAQSYVSPNNKTETCRILNHIPGGDFSKKDVEQETLLCSINFYADNIALCPKNSSTSAAIVVFDISKTGMTPDQYEATQCEAGAGSKLAKMKTTMNQGSKSLFGTTSGTTSTSSLLYYEFSRYLSTLIEIPVAVQRTVDKDVMVNRVAKKSAGQSAMNRAAWKWIIGAGAKPQLYTPTDDLFTADRQQFYGIMLKGKGDRYGAEINSARKAAWGAPQVAEFQTTPAFKALKTAVAVDKAVAGAPYPAEQMVYWMRELSEIAVLDQIFQQQDRIGNVDFQFQWYWIDAAGNVTHRKADTSNIDKPMLTREDAKSVLVPDDIAAFKPILLQRSLLNDNDAGGSPRYAQFAKQAGMVAGLRHFSAGQYVKLQALAQDLQTNGPILAHLKSEYGMAGSQLKMVVNNTVEVAGILKANCKAGKLLFDLDPANFLKNHKVDAQVIDCEAKQ